MNEAIKVGDLVYVALPSFCSGHADKIGYIFKAAAIEKYGVYVCVHCGKDHKDLSWFALDETPGIWWLLKRLKRILPLSELEGAQTKEDLREPV